MLTKRIGLHTPQPSSKNNYQTEIIEKADY